MLYAKLELYPNYRIYIDGRIYSENGNRSKFLKPSLDSHGYYRFGVTKDGKEKKFRIHRILAMCFLPCNCNFSDVSVDHINIDKTDNRLENLRWCDYTTQTLNQKYKETNTGFPFINKCKNKTRKSGFCFQCQIIRNWKKILHTSRSKLEDAVEVVRQFILENNYIFDGYSREKIDKIKEIYKL